jgi:hypothetical protein
VNYLIRLLRLAGISLVTVVLAMLAGGWWFSQDYLQLHRIRHRQRAVSILNNKEPLELLALKGRATELDDERLLGQYAVDKEKALPQPSQPERLMNLLRLAFWEYARDGRFPPDDFEPEFGLRWGQRVVVFSPALRTLYSNVPGWDSCYFEVPEQLSRQLDQCLRPSRGTYSPILNPSRVR